jgi:hypothetical protein
MHCAIMYRAILYCAIMYCASVRKSKWLPWLPLCALPSVHHDGTTCSSQCASRWHHLFFPVCITMAPLVLPSVHHDGATCSDSVHHEGTTCSSHCASQSKTTNASSVQYIVCSKEYTIFSIAACQLFPDPHQIGGSWL